MAGFSAREYNTFLQGKNVGSAEAARVQQWAQSQGYSGNVQSAAGIKKVSSSNDIRQMVDAVNAWGNTRNQQAAAQQAAAQQAAAQAAAQQAELQRQAAARQWQSELDAAGKKAADDAAAKRAAPPSSPHPPPPGAPGAPGGPGGPGAPGAEQPNSAGSYNSQLLKMQAEQQAQSRAAENPAATAYQRPAAAPVVNSGGDRYQDGAREPAPTFTPAPPQGGPPQGAPPQGGPPRPGMPPPPDGPPPGGPPPGPPPEAPRPQPSAPPAPPSAAVPSAAEPSAAAGGQRSIPRAPQRPAEGYGTADSQARGGTYGGSQAWRNFWNPSASAANSGPLPSPARIPERGAVRERAAQPWFTSDGYGQRYDDERNRSQASDRSAVNRSQRMAGDRFRGFGGS